jgi:hypothetical protein
VILHDATLNRVTNCTGNVSSWLWSAIRDRCRTEVGGRKLMRLIDLLKYGNSVGKSFALEIKVSPITDAQAKQLWNAIKDSRVQLNATSARLDALNKIKKLDAADPNHKISYALGTSDKISYALGTLGTGGWPSVSTIKKIGTAVYAKLTIPAEVARSYRLANIKVFLFTGRNASDDARMIALQPYGVVVNDVGPIPELAGRLDWPRIVGLAPCREGNYLACRYASNASNPPARSVTRWRPSSRSVAAARLELYPWLHTRM